MDDDSVTCTLVSQTCTTGWFDWIHGELWLCPDGLLRRSLGLLQTTFPRRRQRIDSTHRPTRAFSPDEIGRIVAIDRRNQWIVWTSVAHATLKYGPTTMSLHLQFGDGRRVKLLWMRTRGGAGDVLESTLARVLPGRFDATRGPLG